MRILVTGVAGFIGNAVALRLLDSGRSHEVFGLDNINDYYDVNLKHNRLKRIAGKAGYSFQKAELADPIQIQNIFETYRPEVVVHLAAQAGVRYSLENPQIYVDSNITGFLNILEGCRHNQVKHLVYASTSSVYGWNTRMPFQETDAASHQISFYAATKKANESMAHSYSALFNLPTTGLRFFTVYGPWGRPDMALFKFTKAILAGEPIDVYNEGHHQRDFTYVDDIVEGIVRLIPKPAAGNSSWSGQNPDPSCSSAPYRIFNIGNSKPVQLLDYIRAIEDCLGMKATKNLLPLQKGDVPNTWADTSALDEWVGYKPDTPVHLGVERFISWYREYYRV